MNFESRISSYGVKEKMKLRMIQLFDLYEQKMVMNMVRWESFWKKISFGGKNQELSFRHFKTVIILDIKWAFREINCRTTVEFKGAVKSWNLEFKFRLLFNGLKVDGCGQKREETQNRALKVSEKRRKQQRCRKKSSCNFDVMRDKWKDGEQPHQILLTTQMPWGLNWLLI